MARIDHWLRRMRGKTVPKFITARLLLPVASVLFVPSAWFGAILWIVIASDEVRLAVALSSLLLAALMIRVLGQPDNSDPVDYLSANALLAGLAVAWIYPNGTTTIFEVVGLAMLASLAAATVTAALERILLPFGLPPLVWGFCLVTLALFASFPDRTAAAAAASPPGITIISAADWAILLLRTIGAFFFSPEPWSGAIIVCAIAIWSRAAFLSGIAGWLGGVLTASAVVHFGAVFDWQPVAYNFFIVGMGLGAIYLLPGWTSLAVATTSGSIAALIAMTTQHMLKFSPGAYLPIALLSTLWIGLVIFRKSGRRIQQNRERDLSPEKAWWQTRIKDARWGQGEPLLTVPLYGTAEITQGFDGSLSHIGKWRHALDFQRPRTSGASTPSIFGEAALAPAPGTVVAVENWVPDNPVGVSNFADNWGNYAVIRLDQGGWVLLSHLRQGTLAVALGTRVTYGTVIGQVGNSGRSPTPHLHLQVQNGPLPGAPTKAFRLANYVHGQGNLSTWEQATIPEEGTILAAAPYVARSHQLLAGTAPGAALWTATVEGKVPAAWCPTTGALTEHIDITLDSAGRQQITAGGWGRIIARWDMDAWRIVSTAGRLSPLQRLITHSIPSIPYCVTIGLQWRDVVPAHMPGLWAEGLRLFAPYVAEDLPRVQLTCRAHEEDSNSSFTIEAIPQERPSRYPDVIVTTFEPIRGPSKIVATFREGAVTWSLVSFEVRS